MNSPPPVCAPPDPATRRAQIVLPRGACDCHAHVCGPAAQYPLYARRIYTPADAAFPAYVTMLSTLGIERAVLVQPSFYGTDNSAMLDAIAAAGPGFRGVAVVAADVTDAELERLHQHGVRGVRVNIVDTVEGKGVLPRNALVELARRVRPLGWHMEFLMHVDEFPRLDRDLEDFPVDVVFGHLGYVRADRGISVPGFQALLRLMRSGRAWVKLTGPYRISAGPLPHADTDAYARALLEAAPQRVVWGTDWPHVMAKWHMPMPNDADFVDLLARWVPEPALREQVLVKNPGQLYQFPPLDSLIG
jgi:predicted TIM-barrel fold metal-dependent hydrolase